MPTGSIDLNNTKHTIVSGSGVQFMKGTGSADNVAKWEIDPADNTSVQLRIPKEMLGTSNDRIAFYMSSSGRVGIGTKDPQAAFDVRDTAEMDADDAYAEDDIGQDERETKESLFKIDRTSGFTEVTASGNISSSGTITAEHFHSSDDISIPDGGKYFLSGDADDTYITTGGNNNTIQFVANSNVHATINSATGLNVNGAISSSGAINTLGDVTASGNISGSGNIYATDYFDNSTNINTIYSSLASQKQLTHHQYKANQGTTKTYFGLGDADSEETTTSQKLELPIIAPAAGKLLKIFLRSNKNIQTHSLTFRLETIAAANFSSTPSIIGAQTGNGCQNSEMTTYDFTTGLDSEGAETNVIAAGNAVYISLESDTNFGNTVSYFITCLWEWNLS